MQHFWQRRVQVALLGRASQLSMNGAKRPLVTPVNTYNSDLVKKLRQLNGQTDGIAIETAKQLSKLGARLAITGKGKRKPEELLFDLPSYPDLAFQKIDFASFISTTAFSEEFSYQQQKFDSRFANQKLTKLAQDTNLTFGTNNPSPLQFTFFKPPQPQRLEDNKIQKIFLNSNISLFHRELSKSYIHLISEEIRG